MIGKENDAGNPPFSSLNYVLIAVFFSAVSLTDPQIFHLQPCLKIIVSHRFSFIYRGSSLIRFDRSIFYKDFEFTANIDILPNIVHEY